MRQTTTLLLLLLVAPLLSGCLYSREIAHIRSDIEDATGADLDREITLTIGPRLFNSLGWIARQVPEVEAQMAAEYIADIDRVKVGVYHVSDWGEDGALNLRSVPRLNDSGWEVAVRVEEGEGVVWLLTRERYGDIRDLLIVTTETEEVVIVRIEGNLNAMVARAVADKDFLREMLDLPGPRPDAADRN